MKDKERAKVMKDKKSLIHEKRNRGECKVKIKNAPLLFMSIVVGCSILIMVGCVIVANIHISIVKSGCSAYNSPSEMSAEELDICTERLTELREIAQAQEKSEREALEKARSECSAKEYEWNIPKVRCNTDEEQAEIIKKKTEELAKRKTECESKPYHTWSGSSCTTETWTKELGWSEVENNQCYVDAVYDKMDDRYGNSFDILGHYDGLDWSATEYYSGGTLTKTDVYFGYKFLKSGNLHMAKCEIKNCKCSSLESKG